MSKSQEVSALEAHLGYWLRFVSNHVSQAFKVKLEARGVTVAEWVIMRSLFDVEKINPSQLAEKVGMTRGTVSKLVDRLSAKHLVSCRSEKIDRRYQIVALTDAGRRLVPTLASLADQNDEQFFAVLDAKDRVELTVLMKKIALGHGLKRLPVD